MRPAKGVCMRDRSEIEWTDSTWNPVTGCTPVSAGCDNCYAKTLAETRLAATYLARLPVVQSNANLHDPFAVRVWQERLAQPFRWRKPRMIFVNSMSDLFHNDIPAGVVRRIFETMIDADWHIYQVLTKRPSRIRRFLEKNADLMPNGIPSHVWIGTSVENAAVAHRSRHLANVPASVRFLSCEPLIGPLELNLEGIHWVIVGGESGKNPRPMSVRWARAIRDQCVRAGVPFFFKQWGGITAKSGGRLLDGQEWNQLPVPAKQAEKPKVRTGRRAVASQ